MGPINNLPQFTSMHLRPKSKKRKTIALNIGLLVCTFTDELGDNLTNSDGDILTANSNST